jgi:methylphosphotriester-DNA--protein-cysteine methyltransferase
MHALGYADDRAFREVVKKITGLSPLAYRAKHNKEALMGRVMVLLFFSIIYF